MKLNREGQHQVERVASAQYRRRSPGISIIADSQPVGFTPPEFTMKATPRDTDTPTKRDNKRAAEDYLDNFLLATSKPVFPTKS